MGYRLALAACSWLAFASPTRGYVQAPQAGARRARAVARQPGATRLYAKRPSGPKRKAGKAGSKPTGGGFAAPAKAGSKAPSAKFDPALALRESEKAFERLEKDYVVSDESGESYRVREYVIAARAKGPNPAPQLSDWVPIGQMLHVVGDVVMVDHLTSPAVTAALASLCRETAECLKYALPAAAKATPRENLEYALELRSEWYDLVYEGAFQRKTGDQAAMSRAEAAEVLGVDGSADGTAVKRAHRKLAMKLHPDAPDGDEALYMRAQEAYEVLGGGVGDATVGYEAIGGRARQGFSGPLDIAGQKPGQQRLASEMALELGGWRAAVRPISDKVVKFFGARNAARSATAKAELKAVV